MNSTSETSPERLSRVRVVLIETSHPGNIGAAARALKTMGLGRLYLVRPVHYPHADATARASGADDVLAGAVVCDSLDAAIEGCTFVLGTSARPRSRVWPEQEPRTAAGQAVSEAAEGEVALLFGRERTGLSNEELDRCQLLTRIPANPDYSSLNLASAVQILAYECRRAALGFDGAGQDAEVPDLGEPLAPSEDIEGFYDHLQTVLGELGFLKTDTPEHLMRQLRRLYARTRLTRNEVNILRGILSAVQGRKLPQHNKK
ncbi:MAG: RNA methyltransferase [Gammaproteobacteria bacterium]|jgi:tRNA (cytidine32/uridine32-2'-O)-methyltransferase